MIKYIALAHFQKDDNALHQKTTFPKSWNISESSKRPTKYHVPMNFSAQKKHLFNNSKSSKQELFKAQNKNFPVISKYHLSINFLAQKRPYFPSPESSKQELFMAQNKNVRVSSKYYLSINFLAQKRPYFPSLESSKQELFSNQ